MEHEIIEGEVNEDGKELIPFHTSDDLAVMPVIDLGKAKQRYNQMVSFVQDIMREEVDYGTIPGTAKPTLYKPGAEKLATFFGLRKTFVPLREIEDWDKPLFFYKYKSQLWRGDMLIAEGIGSASSMEDRYRWRWVSEEKVPPSLDPRELETRGGKVSEFEFAINESRTEGDYAKPQEYWDKFKTAIADGTAVQFQKEARSGKAYPAWEIDSKYYRVPNPDTFTQVNTIDKMAQKRAFIQAVLLGVNASEFFTQDIEDMPIETLSGQEDRYTPPPQYDVKQKAEEGIKTLFGDDEPKKQPGTRPYAPGIVRDRILERLPEYKGARKDESRPGGTLVTFIAWQMSECFKGDKNADTKRIAVLNYIFGPTESTKDLNGAQLRALEWWLGPGEYEGPGAGWTPRKEAQKEAVSMVVAHLKEQGQQELVNE